MLIRSLAFRLAFLVGAALSAGLAAFMYFSMTHHESALLDLTREEATLLSDTIKRSLTYAMHWPEGRKSIHKVIQDVSAREEIERVRIFNAVGLIQYSSDPAEMGRVVDKDAENCKECHDPDETRPRERITDRSRLFYTPEDAGGERHRVLALINPIYNQAEDRCTDCHQQSTVLGVLDVVVSLDNLDAELENHRDTLLLFGVLGVGLMLLAVGTLIHYLLHKPIGDLLDGTRKVGLLNLDYRIPTDRKDELGNLARAFNEMTERLQTAQVEIRDFADQLESKVEEKTEELRETHALMGRREKMAAIGQMAAGVAHEVNNPLTGVITFAHLLRRKADPESRDHEDLSTIIREAERCSKIVRGLLDFARSGELDRRRTDLAQLMDRTLGVVEHQATFLNIEIVRDYASNAPPVEVDADRIAQVFLNLVMNAAEAMESGGTLTIRAGLLPADGQQPESVKISVGDTGPGVPADIQGRIFDPFFTTKETGKGTGLGLSVSYRIIEDHGGRIDLSSGARGGATFTVVLPARRRGGEA